MLLSTIAGLAIFLLGLQRIVAAMHDLAEAGLRRSMSAATRSPWRALATGTGVGALSQSGTATAISALGLVTAGIMAVREGIAYSLGAQIGATLAIQLAAFRVSVYALPMIGIGYLLQRWQRGRILGELLLGAGLLFFGLTLIVDSMALLLEGETLTAVLTLLERSPIAFALMGALIGAILTSTNATTALALGLFAAGGIGLPAAIAFVAGGNAGGTAIAILAARALGTKAVQVATVHTLMKLLAAIGVAMLAEPAAQAIALIGGDGPRQIANTHTLFNVVVALPGVVLAGLAVSLAGRALPERRDGSGPKHLSERDLSDASMALAMVRREAARLADKVTQMAEGAVRLLRSGSASEGTLGAQSYAAIALADAIIVYLAEVRERHKPEPASATLVALVSEVSMVANLLRQLEQREEKLQRSGVDYSPVGRAELTDAAEHLLKRLNAAFTAWAANDGRLAADVIAGRPEYEALIGELRLRHLGRLEARLPSTRLSHTHHMEVLSQLRTIDASITRIAGDFLRFTANREAPVQAETDSGSISP